MIASILYAQTLSTLTDTRSTMLSPAWQDALDLDTPDVRLQASLKLLQVQQAIGALSNAALADIADEMTAEEEAIKDAVNDLEEALKAINQIQDVLSKVTDLLTTVAKIVTLT